MSFRDKATLEHWLQDFSAKFPGSEPYVADQEENDGADAGLVVLPLRNVTTVAFLQPDGIGSARWLLTFEAQPELTELDGNGLRDLAEELLLAANLCDYLELRAGQHSASTAPER